jgi:SynChlorMet cassette radical SAM/SPASM protein ScmF
MTYRAPCSESGSIPCAIAVRKRRIMDNHSDPTRTYPLTQLYFYLTKGCNLRCRHCWIAPRFQGNETASPSLDVGTFRTILSQARPLGLDRVKLTGGEPLIHPHIDDILDTIRAEGFRLVVETNGTRCTTELVEKIKACTDPFVSVSLDGSDRETHDWVRGVQGCFDASLEGIRRLARAGLNPQVIMSVMRRNRDQVESVVRLAESLGAGSVKFNVVQPTARGELMHAQGETLAIEELVALGAWVERELSRATRLRLFFSHPAAFRPMSRMFGDNGDGAGVCGIFSVLGVLGDGAYALCGIGETVGELVFGHADTDSLAEIWDHHPVLKDIREGIPQRLGGICGDCILKALCLGSCVAQNYYASKSLWAPNWFCQAACDKGLFPETRAIRRNAGGARTQPRMNGQS